MRARAVALPWPPRRTTDTAARAPRVRRRRVSGRRGAGSSFCTEELHEDSPAFRLEDASRDVQPVVEAGIADEVAERSDESRLRVRSAVDEARQAREDDRARAHRARLERDVQRAACEPP